MWLEEQHTFQPVFNQRGRWNSSFQASVMLTRLIYVLLKGHSYFSWEHFNLNLTDKWRRIGRGPLVKTFKVPCGVFDHTVEKLRGGSCLVCIVHEHTADVIHISAAGFTLFQWSTIGGGNGQRGVSMHPQRQWRRRLLVSKYECK